ncbi:DUF6555 family protein [Pseudomonas fluorescens]
MHGTQPRALPPLEEAWHWASCDVGVGRIPRFGREKCKKTSEPMAEKSPG